MHLDHRLTVALAALALVGACDAGRDKPDDPFETDTAVDSADTADSADTSDTAGPVDTSDTSDTIDGAAAYAGGWSGTWSNTTFSSTGSASLSVVIDDAKKEATFGLDLNGNVFGGNDPPLISLKGTYTATSLTVSATGDALFGDLTLTFDADGTVNGTATPPGLPGGLTFTGTATPKKMDISYGIDDGQGGSYAIGTLEFSKIGG